MTRDRTKMNPLDNDNSMPEKQQGKKRGMRNKTPWFWQNFWEGLADEALPDNTTEGKEHARRGHRHGSIRGSTAWPTDEQLPDPRPLLDRNSREESHNDAITSSRSIAPTKHRDATDNGGHPEYIVVEHKNLSDYHDIGEGQSTQYEHPREVASVPKWQVDEQEELNPRWIGLANSFKDVGMQ